MSERGEGGEREISARLSVTRGRVETAATYFRDVIFGAALEFIFLELAKAFVHRRCLGRDYGALYVWAKGSEGDLED